MKNTFKFHLLLLILLMPLFVYGDTLPPPRTYSVPSTNNKFVFVMIAPIEIERDGISYGDQGKKAAKKIRNKYPKSGMYLNDGSTEPLWTVDWYSQEVLVPADGVHLIRKGPWASKISDEAFTIFANGEPIRSYKISDLITSTKNLPRGVSHFGWEKNMSIDDQKMTLSVITLNNEQYLFDLQTGSVVSKNNAKN